MGGALTVQSKPGAGSRFELRLPAKRVTAEPPQQMPVKIAAPNSPRVRKRILVVEDSPDAQNLIRQFLAGVNAELVSVENGKEAIDAVTKAEQDKEGFDVVLMDMQMPVMNGFQATRILRQRGFRKPIIAVTAHSLEGDREKCLESGCSDYVSKPIDWSVLISKLEAA